MQLPDPLSYPVLQAQTLEVSHSEFGSEKVQSALSRQLPPSPITKNQSKYDIL